jgi:hypothetical protein
MEPPPSDPGAADGGSFATGADGGRAVTGAEALPLITFPCGADNHDGNHMAGQPASGCSNGSEGDSMSREGMEYLQRFRRYLQLPCLETPDYAQAAAGWHAIYMSEHASGISGHSDCFADGHHEKPGCTYFTGVTPNDQLQAEGMPSDFVATGQDTGDAIACRLSSFDFFAGMLAAPYHRQALMNPATDHAGFATFWQNHVGIETWTNTITLAGRAVRDGSDPELVVYPRPGDPTVPRSFSGQETPTPPAPPQGFPSGYPITVYGRPGMTWTSSELCELSNTSKCTPTPHVFLTSQNDPHVPQWVAHIYANFPMKPNQRYEARFNGTRDGVPWQRWWRFRTKP